MQTSWQLSTVTGVPLHWCCQGISHNLSSIKKEKKTFALNTARRILFVLLQWRGETFVYTRLNSTQTKGRRLLKCGGVLKEKYWRMLGGRDWSIWLGHLCLWIHTYIKEEKQTSQILTTGGSFANWSKVPIQVRLSLPQELRDRETISLDVCISERWFPGLLGHVVW